MTGKTIRLDRQDNIVVCRENIVCGTYIPEERITARRDVPAGFKIAAAEIKKGQPILKYNSIIGYAARDIRPGEPVHDNNVEFRTLEQDYAFCSDYKRPEPVEPRTFNGYVRNDGRVATRNYIGIFAMSNCAATVVRKIAAYFDKDRMRECRNIDGVVPFVIASGCGMESSGEAMDRLRRTIFGYMDHPCIGAVVAVALGCERNDINDFFRVMGRPAAKPCIPVTIQDAGGTQAAVDQGINEIRRLLSSVGHVRREPVPVSHLTLALECGGSDSFSGISANPALGAAVDKLVAMGGTAILAEITEIFGAEHFLTRRAASPQVARKLLDHIAWWKSYSNGRDTQINGHVTPGNSEGGLTNVLEKSLGGIKKGGTSGLMAVLDYAEKTEKHGLVFMDTPGYDPVAVTGQIAGGANLVAFTTGRGSCFGSVPVPTYKIATNTGLYNKMTGDMDLNCGLILDGEKSIEEMGDQIFDDLCAVASGQKTKSELLGAGKDEFQPWNIGVIS